MATNPWSLIVPVKLLALAKSRIADAAGPHRQALALAVAADTVAAALSCPLVGAVVVVTDDALAAAELAAAGARIVPDEPDRGLNPALVHGAGRARLDGPVPVGALSADLPALRPAELTRALTAAADHENAFVPDLAGTGTTLYTASAGVVFAPAFGNGSRDRHVALGVKEIDLPDIPSVRRDVDTADDLREALALGLGPRTERVARLILGRGRPQ
ncbi:2-phospho-L-lactate guanylyltransferase [Actinocorallia longicatena]|uniref:Phosphoenolpyruvate guanylyltransferase n=1 Tax=Actinocorallia longicatena TaxID=111803 RepID=A0ABP6Q2A6_9ACTN